MRVAVVGPGAVGLYLLGHLAENAANIGDLILIGRNSSQTAHLLRKGFTLIEQGRETRIKGTMLRAQAQPKSIDLAILTVKSHDVPKAARNLRRLLSERGYVVSLQNGVTHPRQLFSFKSRVLYGLTLAGCDKTAENQVHVYQDAGLPAVVLHAGGNPEALESVMKLFNAAGIVCRKIPGSLEGFLWTKALYNAALNPVSALLMKKNGEILESGPAKEMVQMAFEEGLGVLMAANKPLVFMGSPSREFPWRIMENTAGNRSSMYQDIVHGRTTEADAILKPFLDLGRKHKSATPVLKKLYLCIKAYEKIRKRLIG